MVIVFSGVGATFFHLHLVKAEMAEILKLFSVGFMKAFRIWQVRFNICFKIQFDNC